MPASGPFEWLRPGAMGRSSRDVLRVLPGWDVGRNAGWSLDGSLGRSGPGLALLHSTPHSHPEPGIPRGPLLSAGDVFFRIGPLGGLILFAP
jgi:hypothetical protein